MGDLISRSALMEVLEKYKFGAISNDAERDYVKETVLNFVKEQPTAYDVEKVVAEVKDYRELVKGCYLKEIVDIVKRGEVE